MNEKEYFKKLSEAKASRLNQIIVAVNKKIKKKDAGLKDEFEEMFYDRLMKEAKAHEAKYGRWPVFDVSEIESDDPALDIYSSPAEKRARKE